MRCLLPFLIPLVASCQVVPPGEINDLYQDVIQQRRTAYRIRPGDNLTIRLFNQDEFTQALLVLPDGRTDPYFMDNLIVAGKTVDELKEEISRAYGQQARNPEISLLVTPAGEMVYLEGAVRTPGPRPYSLNMTLTQLLATANGYLDTASIDDVILRRSIRNPDKPDVFRISLYDDSEEIFLLPDDHIIVTRTYWIVFRDYLREYIFGMLPFSPGSVLSAGAAL